MGHGGRFELGSETQSMGIIQHIRCMNTWPTERFVETSITGGASAVHPEKYWTVDHFSPVLLVPNSVATDKLLPVLPREHGACPVVLRGSPLLCRAFPYVHRNLFPLCLLIRAYEFLGHLHPHR